MDLAVTKSQARICSREISETVQHFYRYGGGRTVYSIPQDPHTPACNKSEKTLDFLS